MNKKAAVGLMLLSFTASPAVSDITIDDLSCDSELPPGVELRITYGPFWDGTWQLSVVREDGASLPQLQTDTLVVAAADYTVTVTESHRRVSNDVDLRLLRQASSVMIAEMRNFAEERPELRSEQKPLMIQVRASEGTTCAAGYANWPRLPGSYYFEAVDHLRAAVSQPNVTRDPWSAARLHLRQVRSAWQR